MLSALERPDTEMKDMYVCISINISSKVSAQRSSDRSSQGRKAHCICEEKDERNASRGSLLSCFLLCAAKF